jgi:hypothetical protein
MPEKSPERSLIRGAAHRRMQSLQTNSVRDLRSYLDGTRSPERSPERTTTRATTPTRGRELDRDIFSSPAPSPSRAQTPTPSARDPLKDAPSLRPTSRPPPKAILGENTPPSATMLALQTLPAKEFPEPPPLSNITNGSTSRKPEEFGAISTQILSLTTICTNLQREMAQLSRRSKDNATDLVSLKEATSTRDEDIRKSLRELVTSVNTGISAPAGIFGAREHSTPPPGAKSFVLPRIPSPSSLFEDRIGSPSPYSVEGVASVAMLEKIIREMVTKDGQEQILSTLSTLFDKASKDSGETAKKVDDMCQILKSAPASRALVASNPGSRDGPQPQTDPLSGPLTRTTREVQPMGGPGGGANPGAEGQSSFSSPKAADFVSDEMIKLLKKIKESVTNTGGMVGEVKAQQRDLRGEVLHMGRDIARKIDESRQPASGARAIEDGSGKQDIARIVQEGLADLKEYLDTTMREKRRTSSSTTMSRSSVNSQEVYDVVKHSITQQGLDRAPHFSNPGLDKDAILEAVKEAYEEYKPDVHVEQFGLERDEILQCLKDGLEQHQSAVPENTGMSREEIMDAIHDAMQNFHPPPPINEANDIRDEVLMVVRECLDEYKPSMASSETTSRDTNRELDLTRQIILDTIKSGLAGLNPNVSREIEISRDDLFDAVKAGMESSGSPFGRYGEMVVNQLHEMVQEIRGEFKDYSTANGRDTEQVLDAMKDGLESLRVDIEQYVDRAQDVTSKDEIVDTVRGGLEHLRRDVETYCAAGPRGDNALSRTDMLDYIKLEFEHLHDAVNGRGADSNASGDKAAILSTIHDGFESLKANMSTRGFDDMHGDEMNEAMKAEFEQLREAVIGSSSVHKDETIDMIQSGFDTLHGKIDGGAFATGSGEEILRSVKEELEHLKETLASTMTRSGGMDEDSVRETLEGMRTQLVAEQSAAARESLGAIQGEFEHLRETITSALISSGSSGAGGETIQSIQQSLDSLREQLADDNGATSKEVLDAVQSEFESLRSSLGGQLVLGGSSSDKDEILEALRSTLDAVQEVSNKSSGGLDDNALGAIRGEFEMLRSNINSGFSRTTQRADTEDILECVRLGFDDLRSDLIKKIDNPEQHMKATGELLDALNEGLESFKTDVGTKTSPIDMTVSYEILDTLKDGIAGLRTDIEKLKSRDRGLSTASHDRDAPAGNEVVLAEDATSEGSTISREVPASVVVPKPQALVRNDLEKVEVMLAQLQIKVDALDANISDAAFRPQAPAETQPAEGTATKVDLANIENLINEMQGSVDIIAARALDNEAVAKKEDTDAIETLLRNTKAKLDEMDLPTAENSATKEQLEALEALMRITREAIDDLTARVDIKPATKDDLNVVELMIHDLKMAMDELKATKSTEPEEPRETVTKQDLDVLGVLSLEIKEKLSDIHSRNIEETPSKADFEELKALVHEFRDSHDVWKGNYENDISITAKAFDDRKKEADDTVTAIGIVKSFLQDVKDELKTKLDDNALDVTSLADNFKILEKTIESNFNVTADVKELMEIVNREFDRVHGAVEDVKMDNEQKATTSQEKNDEARQLAIAEVCTKLDERFDTIMSKYDDAQTAAEAQLKAMEEKSVEQEAILATTKDIAEELRVSIDTLGMTITSMESRFNEIAEKVGEDSQTCFNKIEEGFTKLDDVETRASAKDEHQLTRDEVSKALDAINGIQGDVTEFHPKFMVTLQEVHALINQHQEQSQKAQEAALKAHEAAQEHAKAATEHSRSITEEIKSSFTALPALLPPPSVVEAAEKYDDAQVHEKLDKLMETVNETKEASTQLDRLDKIHQQVMATAAEVSQFVTSQTRLITDGHESKQKEVEEMALLLERRTVEKEHLETDIQALKSDKDGLLAIIETLKSERDALASQKAKIAAEVSALQTTISIRHEELHAMDDKADALERRIMEGIMNQSRVLLMKNGVGRNPETERNVSNASHSTIGALPPPSAASQGLSMALKSRPAAVRRNGMGGPNTGNRRVMSLNPITHNTPTGAQGYQAANSVLSSNAGSGILKRSQSVRTNAMRKVSWNSAPDKSHSRHSLAGPDSIHDMHEDDKENEGNGLSDIDQSDDEHDDGDYQSDTGTQRRASYASESGLTYDDESTDRRTSRSGTEASYETGTSCYMTGSDLTDRRSSYGSTIRSTVGADTVRDEDDDEGSEGEDDEGSEHEQDAAAGAEAEHEEEEGVEEGNENFELAEEGVAKKEMVVYAAPSDSGLGVDMPTAGLSGSETDYFRRAAEDAASASS